MPCLGLRAISRCSSCRSALMGQILTGGRRGMAPLAFAQMRQSRLEAARWSARVRALSAYNDTQCTRGVPESSAAGYPLRDELCESMLVTARRVAGHRKAGSADKLRWTWPGALCSGRPSRAMSPTERSRSRVPRPRGSGMGQQSHRSRAIPVATDRGQLPVLCL